MMIGVLVFVAVCGGLALSDALGRITAIWAANAILVYFLLKCKWKDWAPILAVGFAANFCGEIRVRSSQRKLRELADDVVRSTEQNASIRRTQHTGVVVRVARGDGAEVEALERLDSCLELHNGGNMSLYELKTQFRAASRASLIDSMAAGFCGL